MSDSFSRKFLAEAGEGTPGRSFYGQALKAAGPRMMGRRTRLLNEPAGTHPGGRMFGGIGGDILRLQANIIPVVRRPFYGGEYPLDLQPTIDKPNPWEG